MTRDQKIKALLYEAQRWVGVRESPGNTGELVKFFQMAVDGQAMGESWCAGFVSYCLMHVDRMFYEVLKDTNFHKIPKSESSLFIWDHSEPDLKSRAPSLGSIAVWKTGASSGHVGIVRQIKPDEFLSIEGNTKAFLEPMGPEGVCVKTRRLYTSGSFQLLGFINPWRENGA